VINAYWHQRFQQLYMKKWETDYQGDQRLLASKVSTGNRRRQSQISEKVINALASKVSTVFLLF